MRMYEPNTKTCPWIFATRVWFTWQATSKSTASPRPMRWIFQSTGCRGISGLCMCWMGRCTAREEIKAFAGRFAGGFAAAPAQPPNQWTHRACCSPARPNAAGSARRACPPTWHPRFDVGGNNFRVIAVLHYDRQKLYVREVFTHAEYDRWNKSCRSKSS